MKHQFSKIHLLTHEAIQETYLPVSKYAHKGSNGVGILIAGSRQMPGAAMLAARAAMRSGLGKLIVHAPASVLDKVIPYLPEAILSFDTHSNFLSDIPDRLQNCDALAIGPGLGKESYTQKALYNILTKFSHPMIVDADALNILAENREWFSLLPEKSILTPHARECDRLTGESPNRFERTMKIVDFAHKFKIIVILKGHLSTIVFPDGNIFLNPTGNQGMATAGCGDVLTGIILGLLAKGYSPENAAKTGVFLHGLAGDFALLQQSHESLVASDIIENLGQAFLEITA